MKAERKKRLTLVALAALLVTAACWWMNSRIHVAREDGTPVGYRSQHSSPVRLSRSYGWPRAVWVRTNWATVANGTYVFDEQMRPRESTFHLLGLVPNIAVFFVLLTTTGLVVSAAYDRRFSLRGLLLFMACVAALIVLLGTFVQTEFDRGRHLIQMTKTAEGYDVVMESLSFSLPKDSDLHEYATKICGDYDSPDSQSVKILKRCSLTLELVNEKDVYENRIGVVLLASRRDASALGNDPKLYWDVMLALDRACPQIGHKRIQIAD